MTRSKNPLPTTNLFNTPFSLPKGSTVRYPRSPIFSSLVNHYISGLLSFLFLRTISWYVNNSWMT